MPNTLPKPGANAPRLIWGHHPNAPISRLALACGSCERPDEQEQSGSNGLAEIGEVC